MKTSFLVFYFSETESDIVRTPDLFEERVLALRDIGYDGFELMIWDVSLLDRERLVRFREENGLTFSALGTGKICTRDKLSFSDPDETVRKEAVGRIKGIIDLAAELGHPPVIIGSVRGKHKSSEGWAYVRDCLTECGRYGEEKGVKLAMEPMTPGETPYVNTVEEGLRMLEEVGSPAVGLLLDNCIMARTETDIHEAVAKAAGKIAHVQIGELDRRYPSHGDFDFLSFFAALAKAGYEGFLSAELDEFDTPLGDAEKAFVCIKETAARAAM